MDAKNEIRLGGRVFVPTDEDDMTFDQFAWIQSASEKAGLGVEMMQLVEPHLEKIINEEERLSDEQAEVITTKIVSRCYEGRAHLDVLAGMLTEKGVPWSYEGALKNREFFGALKGKKDIEIANAVTAEAILSFFWNGLASTKIFQNSSKTPAVLEALRATMDGEPVPEDVSETFES